MCVNGKKCFTNSNSRSNVECLGFIFVVVNLYWFVHLERFHIEIILLFGPCDYLAIVWWQDHCMCVLALGLTVLALGLTVLALRHGSRSFTRSLLRWAGGGRLGRFCGEALHPGQGVQGLQAHLHHLLVGIDLVHIAVRVFVKPGLFLQETLKQSESPG